MRTKIYGHGSYIGTTGYNHHTRDFFRNLFDFTDIKFRNFSVGKTWRGYNLEPHNDEPYIDNLDKKLLYRQILFNNDNSRSDYEIYPDPSKEFNHDLNIVLCETDHYIFYDGYVGPKIAYNVWESTLQPQHFFNQLKDFDELWVPSEWQKECTVKQGYDANKIQVVPEGVDDNVFFPEEVAHPLTENYFTFFLAGRWDYRKSTKEIIQTFLDTFKDIDNVRLIVSIDNPFSNDGLKTTNDRLKFYNLESNKIIVLNFPSREDYIKLIKSCNVFLSCARSEGWNLPLIEAMASGTPSIYSNCSGQLQFAKGKGIPVDILGEKPSSESSYNHFNSTVGNYYEPDFEDLKRKMLLVYNEYDTFKSKSLIESEEIRRDFNWTQVAKIGYDTVVDFLNRKPWLNKSKKENTIHISYIDGPRVEILGDESKEYLVEFLNEKNEVLYSSEIKNNMWTACGKKYLINWTIKINGEVYDKLDLKDKRVLISLESKSIGDTVAWAPYAVEFSNKYQCKVVLSTFHNSWFKGLESYKDIEFINPGQSTECYALYRIGWFRDKDDNWKNFDLYPNQVNLVPLQQTATDILNLPFEEKNFGLDVKIRQRPLKEKYVVFGPEATSGCKEWTYEHWVNLSKMIKKIGYEVVILSNRPYHIHGIKCISGRSWDEVSTYLYYADRFIGLGSGLSWVNWALGKHTYMINGFAQEGHEFTSNLTKITNNLCIKCWNDPIFSFDAGDWDWCPVYKGTELQHICQKSITPLQVFNILNL